MATVSDFSVGDSVRFPNYSARYPEGFVGTVVKVGRKNLTVRYTKGAGAHLFVASLDPTAVEVVKVCPEGAVPDAAGVRRHADFSECRHAGAS